MIKNDRSEVRIGRRSCSNKETSMDRLEDKASEMRFSYNARSKHFYENLEIAVELHFTISTVWTRPSLLSIRRFHLFKMAKLRNRFRRKA